MAILEKGLVQIYTGDGKGKTTAAFGLAWRMLGRGGSVYIAQFLKPAGRETGEALLAARFSGQLTLDRLDLDWDMKNASVDTPQKKQMQQALCEKMVHIRQFAAQGQYDLMILDEILVCLKLGLIDLELIVSVLNHRARHVELVLTGRDAPECLLEKADLVTRMEPVKHPYDCGISARKGIEY